MTASKGSLSVDTGPTTLVAEVGSGRAAGGGQPQLSFGSDAENDSACPAGSGSSPVTRGRRRWSGACRARGRGRWTTQRRGRRGEFECLGHGPTGSGRGDVGGTAIVGERAGGGALALRRRHAARRDHDAADELIQPESPAGVAHLARKAAQDGQLPLGRGGRGPERRKRLRSQRGYRAGAEHRGQRRRIDQRETDFVRCRGGHGSLVAAPVGQGSTVTCTCGPPNWDLAARAEAADVASGEPRAGGGTGSPPRLHADRAIVASMVADTVEVAGARSRAVIRTRCRAIRRVRRRRSWPAVWTRRAPLGRWVGKPPSRCPTGPLTRFLVSHESPRCRRPPTTKARWCATTSTAAGRANSPLESNFPRHWERLRWRV